MSLTDQHEQYLKYMEKHHPEKDELRIFTLLLKEIENLYREHQEFFPGFSTIVKANVLLHLHNEDKTKTRNQVVLVDSCWRSYTTFKKMRNFRAL